MDDDSRRLVALGIYHFVNDGSLTLFASALPVMRIALGLDFIQIGTILGAGLLATMLLQLLFGSLSDMGHASRVLVIGFAGVVLVDVFFPLSSTFTQVLVFYVLLRSAAAVYHPVSFASIGRIYLVNRTAAFGFQGAIGDLGLTIATLATGVLSQTWGWREPFWVWGGIGLVLFAYFVTTVMRHRISFYARFPVPARETDDNPGNSTSLRLVFAILAAVYSLTTVSFILFTGYMPLYFNIIEGLSPAWSTALVAVWIAIGVLAGFMTGRVVSKLGGESRTLRIMFGLETALLLIATVTLYVESLSSSGSLVRFAALVLTGIPVFITFPAASGLLGLRTPHGRLGIAYAVNLSLGLMVASMATYLTGYLASLTTIAITLPLLAVVAVLGTLASFKL